MEKTLSYRICHRKDCFMEIDNTAIFCYVHSLSYGPRQTCRVCGAHLSPKNSCPVCYPRDKMVEKYGPSILEEAQKLVHGVRQENYDHPYDNHKRIAGFLSVYLADILKRDITPREAAMCILLVKIAREMFKSKRDNGVDICGYAAVIEMIDQKEEEITGESSGRWHRS